MNREQAIEKIAHSLMAKEGELLISWECAVGRAIKLYDTGYRLIPELKVLSEEEIDKLWDDYEKQDPMQLTDFGKVIAQAQLDADRKTIQTDAYETKAIT